MPIKKRSLSTVTVKISFVWTWWMINDRKIISTGYTRRCLVQFAVKHREKTRVISWENVTSRKSLTEQCVFQANQKRRSFLSIQSNLKGKNVKPSYRNTTFEASNRLLLSNQSTAKLGSFTPFKGYFWFKLCANQFIDVERLLFMAWSNFFLKSLMASSSEEDNNSVLRK